MNDSKLRAILLAALMVLSVAVGTVAFTDPTAASNHSTTHQVRDLALTTSMNATAEWTASGAFIEADDTDGTPGDEARIEVESGDVGISTLGDLSTLSWTVTGGTGYTPHVDVYVDTDGDDVADGALVFEYFKVREPCDGGTPPTGDYNTFGDKGIVNATATAWLASGAPGPCGDSAFVNGTLSEWQDGNVTGNVSASTAVTHLEIEVDNYIQDPSSATVSAVTVNGVTYHGQIQSAVDEAADGDNVALGEGTYDVSSPVSVTTPNVTIHPLAGATPTVESTVDSFQGAFQLDAPGDTITGFEIIVDSGVSNPVAVLLRADDTSATDLSVNQTPDSFNAAIQVVHSGSKIVIARNHVTGGAIGLGDSNVSVRNNTVTDVKAEGIFTAAGAGQTFVIEDNLVKNFDLDDNGVGAIKFVEVPAAVNGETANATTMARSVLLGNDVPSVEFAGTIYLLVTETDTVTNTVVKTKEVTVTIHEHHHHGGGGGTNVVTRTVEVPGPSPTPAVTERTVIRERTVVHERTVTVQQPSPSPAVTERTVIRTVIKTVTETPGQPGFGAAVAILALLAAGLLALRRQD